MRIHHAVYNHAAAMRHKELGSMKSKVLMKALPSTGPSPNTALKYTEEQALWAAAMELDNVANE